MTSRGTLLEDTNASAIASAIVKARRNAGSPAMGMVMTMIVVVDDDEQMAQLVMRMRAPEGYR